MVMPRSFSSGAASISSYVLRFGEALLGKNGGDRRGERGLAVVDVADRADVHVRFVAFELRLGH